MVAWRSWNFNWPYLGQFLLCLAFWERLTNVFWPKVWNYKSEVDPLTLFIWKKCQNCKKCHHISVSLQDIYAWFEIELQRSRNVSWIAAFGLASPIGGLLVSVTKYVQLLSLLTFVCSCVDSWAAARWAQFQSWFAVMATAVYLILYLLNYISRLPGPWPLIVWFIFILTEKLITFSGFRPVCVAHKSWAKFTEHLKVKIILTL